jgi:hypothetical protein
MSFSGFADPEQLKILTSVLDDYCREHGIDDHSPERAAVGRLLVSLFEQGRQSREDLATMLNMVRRCNAA